MCGWRIRDLSTLGPTRGDYSPGRCPFGIYIQHVTLRASLCTGAFPMFMPRGMMKKLMMNLLRQYRLILAVSLVVWIAVWYFLGFSAFLVTVILTVLEITLSADNAVVNSRILVKLSPLWQKLFLTIGIVIAVFVVRFALPILMVALASSLGVGTVLSLALNDPAQYGHKLHAVAPLIDGFGGIFLAMVALFFFVDHAKDAHWLWLPEKAMTKIARVPLIRSILTAVLFASVVIMSPQVIRYHVAFAMLVGIVVYGLLRGMTMLLERANAKSSMKQQVGWAAFGLFMYLQVLDASFSLDGVVGAFAITDSIVIIMAGLGIGALWVRAMTIHMVRHETLLKYKYLESGAHWAIACLAVIMFLKIGGIELPEVVVGSIGLVCIAASIYSSTRARQ